MGKRVVFGFYLHTQIKDAETERRTEGENTLSAVLPIHLSLLTLSRLAPRCLTHTQIKPVAVFEFLIALPKCDLKSEFEWDQRKTTRN
jgi:hypothetical protein